MPLQHCGVTRHHSVGDVLQTLALAYPPIGSVLLYALTLCSCHGRRQDLDHPQIQHAIRNIGSGASSGRTAHYSGSPPAPARAPPTRRAPACSCPGDETAVLIVYVCRSSAWAGWLRLTSGRDVTLSHALFLPSALELMFC